jgi:thiol-disulfide isomerase/thioredoxin
MPAQQPDVLNANNEGESSNPEFRVLCLCAEWCGTCRTYRPGFEELAAVFPQAQFHWVDIEDQADDMGDLDVENFPTLLILRRELVLFFGTMLPHLGHLRRLIETLQQQTPAESREYAHADAERRTWQESEDLRHLGQVVAR